MKVEEFLASQRERLRTDPEYRAAVEAAERETAEYQQRVAEAEGPIVEDLRRAGVDVSSVWDLVNASEPHSTALPVLLAHLDRGGYPDPVMEDLGRALAVEASAAQWDVLVQLYVCARGPGEKEGLAVALSAVAATEHFDQLVRLLRDEQQGQTRIWFVEPVKRLGGERGREVLAELTDDPILGREVRATLGQR